LFVSKDFPTGENEPWGGRRFGGTMEPNRADDLLGVQCIFVLVEGLFLETGEGGWREEWR